MLNKNARNGEKMEVHYSSTRINDYPGSARPGLEDRPAEPHTRRVKR
jgi:hypothetical protein